jgi:hypothetical protein
MTSKLSSHLFVSEVISRSKPTFSAAADHVRKNEVREAEAQAENRARMTVAERYETRVMRRALGLLTTLQALEDAQRMISVFPSQLSHGRAAVSRDRWADYHYGYFTISLASLPDIAVVLAATVCQLGLAPKHCTADVVTSSDVIKGTQVAAALRALARAVQAAKERRNRHVHRGDHAEVDNVSSGRLLRDVKTMTFFASVDPELVDRELLREAWRRAVKEIVPHLALEATRVEEALTVVLDSLLPEFMHRSDKLRKAERVGSGDAS